MLRHKHRRDIAEFLGGATAAVVGLITGTNLALLLGSSRDLSGAVVFAVALGVLFRSTWRWLVGAAGYGRLVDVAGG
ncbi:hypothetical protein [Luteimonas terricola]|uniref:Uncharacterized protein n=1 Tax=Luteimonas terricola TaxID=645597 RepID=A0ABQ2ECB0_9GAMM|nr:hypothetical protein [Luteimonas terricola]GGK06224.1 hypothetical protein GCM10011394_14240 [Luteimonas terricola]